jgi:pimeloyl-ACP methyl ester carboxylesterase
MHVRTLGTGPPLVLVHGSIQNSVTWSAQRPLAEAFTLVLLDRDGYPPGPPLAHIDMEEQARDVAELLGNSAHLGGFSYGGVVALLAAAARPQAVRSLMVIEPPCFGVARGVPAVDEIVAASEAVYVQAAGDPAVFLAGFAALFGPDGRVPAEAPPGDEQGVLALMAEQKPWEVDVPLARLAAAKLPTLVCSSGGHPAYEAVCSVLERALGAERAVLPGAGHAAHRAPGFNERYLEFLRRTN